MLYLGSTTTLINNYMTPKYIIIHSTEVSYNANPDQAVATNNYHRQLFNMRSSLGMYGGYNAEISKIGKVTTFRADGEVTAAAIGRNSDSLHIALDGHFDTEMPTDEQFAALKGWLLEKMAKYSIPKENIKNHRYFATYSIRDGKFIKNTSNFKTWDNCMPYKSCPGALLSDAFGQTLVTPPPSVVSTEDVQKAISLLDRIINLLKSFLAQRQNLGMPMHERNEAV